MITIEKKIDINIDLKIFDLINKNINECAFFDIETTGLSPSNSFLYLIGCIYYNENKWNLIQWLGESLKDEQIILNEFTNFTSKYMFLFNYNGNNFDIPYLEHKLSKYNLLNTLKDKSSIDLYNCLKPLKNLLDFKSLKLSSIMSHIGYTREDNCSGKNLIGVFYHFVNTKDDNYKAPLLLHNKEDVLGLLFVLPLLKYNILIKDLHKYTYAISEEKNKVIIEVNNSIEFKNEICKKNNDIELKIGNKYMYILIKITNGEMKYFFSNFKDYYYLPLEDQAIHKSVASFVESKYKQKAKAKNCYIKKRGEFIPLFFNNNQSIYKSSLNDTINYIELDNFLSNKDLQKEYIKQIINYFT